MYKGITLAMAAKAEKAASLTSGVPSFKDCQKCKKSIQMKRVTRGVTAECTQNMLYYV